MFSAEFPGESDSGEGSSPRRACTPASSCIAEDGGPVRSGSRDAAGIFDIIIISWEEEGN